VKITLTCSEAMMLGAALAPQAFGALVDTSGGTCANGAAYEAGGIIRVIRCGAMLLGIVGLGPLAHHTARKRWPVLEHIAVCPECKSRKEQLGMIVVHLNNDHRWSRERIAAFVATVEVEFAARQRSSTGLAAAQAVSQPAPTAAPQQDSAYAKFRRGEPQLAMLQL
jgi:hypothetical protein